MCIKNVKKAVPIRRHYQPTVGEDQSGGEWGESKTSVHRKFGSSCRNDGHRVDEKHDGEDDEGHDVDGVHDQPRHEEPASTSGTPESWNGNKCYETIYLSVIKCCQLSPEPGTKLVFFRN